MTLEIRPTADKDFAVVSVAPFVLGRFPTVALAEAFRTTLVMRRAFATGQKPFSSGLPEPQPTSPTDVGTFSEIAWTEDMENEMLTADKKEFRAMSDRLGLPEGVLAYHRDRVRAERLADASEASK